MPREININVRIIGVENVKLRNELSEATPTELSKLDHDAEIAQQLATTLFLDSQAKHGCPHSPQQHSFP